MQSPQKKNTTATDTSREANPANAERTQKPETAHTTPEAVKTRQTEAKAGWEHHIAKAVDDQEWLCILSMQTKLPMLQRTEEIVALFKQHVLAQGTEGSICSLRDAKSYMANFLRWGSVTHRHVLTALENQRQTAAVKDPYRYENKDPTTGKRTYCGMPIPDNAPPRPDENAVWGDGEWTR